MTIQRPPPGSWPCLLWDSSFTGSCLDPNLTLGLSSSALSTLGSSCPGAQAEVLHIPVPGALQLEVAGIEPLTFCTPSRHSVTEPQLLLAQEVPSAGGGVTVLPSCLLTPPARPLWLWSRDLCGVWLWAGHHTPLGATSPPGADAAQCPEPPLPLLS